MKNLKLSPNMQAAMWAQDRFERGLNAQRPTMRTVQALVARGLVEKTGRWVSLSKLGKEWLTEQIEAAHAEALREHIARVIDTAKYGSPVYLAAWRLFMRSGLSHAAWGLLRTMREADHAGVVEMQKHVEAIRTAPNAGAHQRAQQAAVDAGYGLVDIAKLLADRIAV